MRAAQGALANKQNNILPAHKYLSRINIVSCACHGAYYCYCYSTLSKSERNELPQETAAEGLLLWVIQRSHPPAGTRAEVKPTGILASQENQIRPEITFTLTHSMPL